jgi:uncharacterized membrane protein YeiH
MAGRRRNDNLVLACDLAATLLFAIEGGAAGVEANFDVFGVIVAGFITAVGGGIIRDLLIGDILPAALRDTRYIVTAIAGATLTFLFSKLVAEISGDVLTVLDAAALGLFAVSGAAKGLDFGAAPLTACILGMITGVGGGVIRDVCSTRRRACWWPRSTPSPLYSARP